MKVKTKNVKPNSSIEHRASSNAFRLLCFSFLSFHFLTSLVGAQIRSEQLGPTDFLMPYLAQTLQDVNTPTVQMKEAKIRPIRQEKPQTSNPDKVGAVNFAAEVNQKLPHRGSAIPGNLSSRLGRQLWRTRISVPGGEKDNRSKSELKRLIEQIRSIEFKPPKQAAEPVIILEPVARPGREPNPDLSGSDVEVKEEPEKKTIESRLPYEPVTDQTLQMLGSIAQHLDQLDSPFELGEVLFFSSRLKEAAVFYQEALRRKSPDKTGSDQDRAWILFQIGNCLRDDDLPTAKKMYRQLIAEYPNSPWVDLAKAREELIDWYQKDKPRILIAECQL